MYTPRSPRASRQGARRSLPAALSIALVLAARAAGAQAPAADTALRDALARGEALLAAGQYQYALREFEALHRANPLDPTALLGVGKSQEGLGRGRIAERTYHEYIAQRPADAVGYANLGHVLASLGRSGDALQAYRDAQRLDLRSAAGRKRCGRFARRRGSTAATRRRGARSRWCRSTSIVGWTPRRTGKRRC